MKKIFLILFVVSSCHAGLVNLDSLTKKSYSSETNARQLHGLFFQRHLTPLAPLPRPLPPDSLFKSVPAAAPVTANNDIRDLQISVAKLSVIVDNLQKQADSHGNNMDFILKLIEIFMGTVSAIVIAYISVKVGSKKK